MKTKVCIVAFLALGPFCASMPTQEIFRGGIVYGPKAVFNIAAPDGWVLDNKSGVKQGWPRVRRKLGPQVVLNEP
jgi:hypothetical protein